MYERISSVFGSAMVDEQLFASKKFEGRSIFDIHQVSRFDTQFIEYIDAKKKKMSDTAKQILNAGYTNTSTAIESTEQRKIKPKSKAARLIQSEGISDDLDNP